MAIGFGPGSEMQRTANNQRKQLRKSGSKNTVSGNSSGEKKGLKFQKATPEQLEAIREKMEKSRRRNFIFMGILFGILLLVIIYIIAMPTHELIFW
jgi:type IV secretory pathway component VirB8